MYGLADRIARNDPGASNTVARDGLAPVVPLVPHGTIMVVDRDPDMLELVRRCLHEVAHIVVARDAAEVLRQLPWNHPDVLLLDMSLDDDQIAAISDGLAATWANTIPVVMLDPAEALNGDELRRRVRAAMRVNGRVYLGGGLRVRMAA
jgi:CheY-like chemotaxis protein